MILSISTNCISCFGTFVYFSAFHMIGIFRLRFEPIFNVEWLNDDEILNFHYNFHSKPEFELMLSYFI